MNLSPVLRQRFFDANGLPLAGGQLFSYIAGTTTPQGTFSNQGGTTNTNPVILDSQGYADVWIDGTKSYKFVLEDVNNNVLWTVDNVSAVPVVSSSIEAYNLGISSSASSGILTVNLKQGDGSTTPSSTSPVSVALRNPASSIGAYNRRLVTGALSQTLSSGTTLGMIASQNNSLWAYLVDSNGAGSAMKLALSSVKWDDRSLQSVVAESFVGTISNGSPGVVTASGHGLNNNDTIQFTTTGGLPTGLSTGTTYYVVASSTNTFEVASSPGGSAINTSSAGSGVHTVHIAGWRLVSDAAYSSVPIRLIGRMIVNLSVSGTWLAPTEIDLGPFQPFEGIMAQYGTAGSGGTANGIIIISGFLKDTHGIYNSSTGNFVIPSTGLWQMSFSINASAGTGIYVSLNSSSVFVSIGNLIGAGASNAGTGGSSGVFAANYGDIVNLRAGSNISAGWGGGNYVTLSKVSNLL